MVEELLEEQQQQYTDKMIIQILVRNLNGRLADVTQDMQYHHPSISELREYGILQNWVRRLEETNKVPADADLQRMYSIAQSVLGGYWQVTMSSINSDLDKIGACNFKIPS